MSRGSTKSGIRVDDGCVRAVEGTWKAHPNLAVHVHTFVRIEAVFSLEGIERKSQHICDLAFLQLYISSLLQILGLVIQCCVSISNLNQALSALGGKLLSNLTHGHDSVVGIC